jgi:hypothetical protein
VQPETGWLDTHDPEFWRERGWEVQPRYASPVVPVGREEAFPPPLFITSGGHLSGFRVSLGYETLAEASDAHAFLAALGTKGADHD